MGKLDPSGVVDFEAHIQKLPDGSNGLSEYYVHLADVSGTVAGGKMFEVNTIMDVVTPLEVRVDLYNVLPCDTNSVASSENIEIVDSTSLFVEDVDYKYEYLKAGEVHTISGVTVKWCVHEDIPNRTILYFDSFERSIVYNIYAQPPYMEGDTGWTPTGKKATECLTTDYAQASSGSCYDAEVQVKLVCEEWIIGPDIGDPYHMTYYFIEYPESFTQPTLGDAITCDDSYGAYHCGANHPYYAASWNRSINSNPFDIGFAIDTSDGTQWKATEVDITFGLSYGYLDFEVTVHLIREGGGTNGAPPKLTVYVDSGDFLYRWYHEQDDTRYIVHFSRS